MWRPIIRAFQSIDQLIQKLPGANMKVLCAIFGGLLPLVIAASVHAQGCNLVPSGIVGWWPAEGNANDIIGTNNGTLLGNLTFANGEVGQAFVFDGSTGVSVPDSPSLDQFGSSITIEAWVRAVSLPGDWHAIVAKGNSSWRVMCAGPGPVTFSTTGVGNEDFTGNKNVCDGNWHHVACVYDGTMKYIYVDGALDASTSASGTIAQNGSALGIGYNPDSGYNWYGSIDEVSVYNRALSAFEIQAIYNAGSSGKCMASAFPTIVSQPTNQSVVLHSNTSFTVSATNAAPVTYQWYFNPANNAGQAGAYALTINGFVYGVVVTNAGFGYGNVPRISFVGGNGSGAAGYATTSNGVLTGITVTNAGFGYSVTPGVAIDPPNGLIYGQTNSTLNITDADANSLGNYFAVVSANGNSVTSSVVSLVLVYPPFILNQPQDAYTYAYGNASFGVTPGGSAPFSYEWQFDNSNLVSATNSILMLSNITQSNLGAYSVVVGNPSGSVTSSIANLYMYPFIATPFTGLVTYRGITNTLSVGAWGTGPLDYQWYDNGIAIADATNQTFTLSSIQFTNAGLYTVVVSSPLGSVTNTPEQVIVNPAGVSLGFSPTLTISGVAGQTYIIESSTNLANPNAWVVLTNLTLTQPVQIWVDTSVDASSPFNSSHFYQILPGH
jgi:hypothetical protein